MTIQIIQLNPNKELCGDQITVSALSQPRALDEYDVNIIDLSDPEIWTNSRNTYKRIDSFDDFSSIHTMVMNRKKANIIYVCPKNVFISYDYKQSLNRYEYHKKIKDDLPLFKNLIERVFPYGFYNINYETTTTSIGEIHFDADFYFSSSSFGIKHISDRSEKIVTVLLDPFHKTKNTIATTLNVTASLQHLYAYLESIFPDNAETQEPSWVKDYLFYNDNELKDKIEKIDKEIIDLNNEKGKCNEAVDYNRKVKSILYSNGKQLANTVSGILEQLLNCNLSNFVDVKKEDFRIEKDDIVFIGEIKGVSSNVKNSYISQVENHYDTYLESANEDDKKKAGKQLLIINPFRDKPLDEREPIMDEQIKKAERNECLIIETKVLLRLYERFLRKEVSTEDCLKLFKSEKGLLSVEQVNEI
ncbi:MAG: hypothetical protein IJK58_01365 [Clostridia bacterium]|nr:hypothetical protein [Clostridia bacterium]